MENLKKDAQDLGLDLPSFIDQTVFAQILEMDDDVEMEFSKSIVYEFFTQAHDTFKDMERALAKKDLPKLSSLGHFLKGSSATLGLLKIHKACEAIQNLGTGRDEYGISNQDDAICLSLIQKTLIAMQPDFDCVKKLMDRFYKQE